MEIYNKEKHHDLVMEHIKQASLERRELHTYSRCDNYGNGLTELVINETDSILMKSKEFQEIFDEVFVGAEYYRTMIDYIVSVDNRTKNQQFVFKVPEGQTSLNYHKWTLKFADRKIADRINKAKKLRNKKLKK